MNEAEFRRLDFNLENTTPVVLGDGTAWHLPRIWLSLRPSFSGGKATAMKLTSSAGTEFDVLRQAADDAAVAGDDGWPMAVASLGAYLLLQNYALDDAHLEALLVFPTTGENAYELLRTIMGVANGRHDPKETETSGSAAPS